MRSGRCREKRKKEKLNKNESESTRKEPRAHPQILRSNDADRWLEFC